MKKTQGSKVRKKVAKLSKKVADRAKKKTRKVKGKTRNLLVRAKKKLKDMKKKSSKSLHHAKDTAYATEQEILDYVKENPVKSISAVALTALIAGFVSSRYKK